ncbi:hypothetical protein A9Q99_17575 [Gammaproteobacteria bacterium 45_16_T64]|nr:hypothetical protein A9Q99_17575 [Gammaproteobacteria bacterium 45_16_T64]
MTILMKVSEIIRDVLDEELDITMGTSASDAEDWDSLANIQIIDAIEKEFDINLSIKDIDVLNKAGNVGATIDLIRYRMTS